MIEFKNPLVRVRCLECREEHFIEMKHIGTDKEQRSIGFEYEHIYRGELKCSHCGEDMRLLTTILEFPKGFLTDHETSNESCLVMDDLTDESFNFSDSISYVVFNKTIMEKKELEFMERFLNIEKQDFTDFEKKVSFGEMCVNMELTNDDIVEIVKSLTERINSFILRK